MSTESPKAESKHPSLIGGEQTFGTINESISSIILKRGTTVGWLVGFSISFALVMLLLYALAVLIVKGVGIWGINVPVSWGSSGSARTGTSPQESF